MRGRRLLLALLVAGAAGGSAGAVQAQQQDPFRLTDVRRSGELYGCGPTRSSRAAASGDGIEIRQGSQWRASEIPRPVRPNEGIGVPIPVDARVNIQVPGVGGGSVFLVPSLACFPLLRADTIVVGIRPDSSHARYEVFTSTVVENGQRVERFGISAVSGSLIVAGYKGPPFLVRAAGDTATVRGTTVAVMVDSTGTEGLLYLESGDLTLSRFPGGVVQPGDLIHLRREGRPVVIAAGLRDLVVPKLREAIRHHTEDVWLGTREPGAGGDTEIPMAEPRAIVPAWAWAVLGGTLAGGSVWCAATTCWDNPRDRQPVTRTGTVILHIPF